MKNRNCEEDFSSFLFATIRNDLSNDPDNSSLNRIQLEVES